MAGGRRQRPRKPNPTRCLLSDRPIPSLSGSERRPRGRMGATAGGRSHTHHHRERRPIIPRLPFGRRAARSRLSSPPGQHPRIDAIASLPRSRSLAFPMTPHHRRRARPSSPTRRHRCVVCGPGAAAGGQDAPSSSEECAIGSDRRAVAHLPPVPTVESARRLARGPQPA